MSVSVTRVADVPSYTAPVEGLEWHPVRHHLGIRAFGTNGYVGHAPGDLVVEAHDEEADEELYVVLHGAAAARFTVDGETFDAPQGTLVLVTPPSHRVAHALEPGTTILAVGARPGQAFEVSPWEERWLAEPGDRLGDDPLAGELRRGLLHGGVGRRHDDVGLAQVVVGDRLAVRADPVQQLGERLGVGLLVAGLDGGDDGVVEVVDLGVV
jgi:hypothetical protein